MRTPLIIFCVALFLRLFFSVGWQSSEPMALKGDEVVYDRLATSLVQGRGLYEPVSGVYSSRMPLYPMFLAFLYRFFGHSLKVVQVVQCILGALLCWFIFLVASKAFGQNVGRITGFLAVIYPPFIRFSYYGGPAFLLSESLFLPLLALGIYFMMDLFMGKGGIFSAMLSGFCLGLATLTRPTLFLFPPFLLLWVLAGYLNSRGLFLKRLKGVCVIWVVLLLVLSPWTIRNYRIHHAFVPLTTKGGGLFFSGNNPMSRGGLVHAAQNLGYPEAEMRFLGEVERDRLEYQKGKEFLIAHKGRIPGLFLKKALVQWSPFIEVDEGKVDYNVGYAVMILFAIIGGLGAIRRRFSGSIPFFLLLAYTTAMAMVMVGDPRYQHPVEPYLIVLAAFGLARLFEMKQRIWSWSFLALVLVPNLFCTLYPKTALQIAKSMMS